MKIDCISDELKPYFMDQAVCGDDHDDEKKENEGSGVKLQQRWTISFDKIYFLFPNLRQIHFLNSYRFDDEVLRRLIKCIEDEDCKLKQIRFLYYDYVGSLDDYKHFYDPSSLDKDLVKKLKSLKWKLSCPEVQNGFVIKIRK